MNGHLVAARALDFHYPDGTVALSGVSFQIRPGEAVAIVGANGAGKSTLLLHLAGCLLPTGGELQVGDCRLAAATMDQVRRLVGLVFQDPNDQLFMPTVEEDVAFGPLNLGLPADEVRRRVDAALAAVGMAALRQRPPYKLSAGEKRAAAIATILAMAPGILVMDEPSAGLDPRARRHLIARLQSFNHTRIIASHDLDLVMDLCERTIILRQGRVAADGATRELLRNQALLEQCGLELPLRLQGAPPAGARPPEAQHAG